MGDKKRKLAQAQNAIEEPVEQQQREGKKARKEAKSKRDDESKTEDVMDVDGAGDSEGKREKKEKKEKKAKEEKRERKEKKKQKKEKETSKGTEGEEKVNGADGEGTLYFVDTKGSTTKDTTDGEVEVKKEKSDKKDKKEKKEKKEKKDKKKDKKPSLETTKEPSNDSPEAEAEAETQGQGEPANGASNDQDKKQTRFIAFVGNLPFTANTESVTAHFAKNPPMSVRVATERSHPEKCRGFGFVEFENFDRMKSCLKLYHHSSFDDGKSPARKINVELTAGGGGKSKTRKAKIDYKNERLEGQRKRAAKQLQEEKTKKAEVKENGGDDFAGVHPSRRSRMG